MLPELPVFVPVSFLSLTTLGLRDEVQSNLPKVHLPLVEPVWLRRAPRAAPTASGSVIRPYSQLSS